MKNHAIALLAEDELLVRIVVADILTDVGFEVIEAANANEALAFLSELPSVKLLMTDVQMPGSLDGFGLARAVARSLPNLRIIVFSGRKQPRPGDLPQGANFVAKPFDVDIVAKLARGALEHGTDANSDMRQAEPSKH